MLRTGLDQRVVSWIGLWPDLLRQRVHRLGETPSSPSFGGGSGEMSDS